MPVEHQGGRRAAGGVEVHGLLQVQVAHRVAADDQKVLVPQKGHAVFYAARGTKGLRLGKVAQVHALGLESGQVEHCSEGDTGRHGPAAVQARVQQDVKEQIDDQGHQYGGEGGRGAPLEDLQP